MSRRVIGALTKRSFGLPGPGWCEYQPFSPPATCSWCGHNLLGVPAVVSIVACPFCDQLQDWPTLGAK